MAATSKAIARRIIREIWNKGHLDLVETLYSEDFVFKGALDQATGPDGYKALVQKYRSAFPDLQLIIDDLIAEGNKVVTRWTCRGTHNGNLPDIPATGKEITVTGITIARLQRGKVVEEIANADDLGMMQQLGVIPELGQPKPQARAEAAAG